MRVAPFGEPITERNYVTELLVRWIVGRPMDDAARVRERAVRLYALALQARERGYTSASELERLANETMSHAEELSGAPALSRHPPKRPEVARSSSNRSPRRSDKRSTSFDTRLIP